MIINNINIERKRIFIFCPLSREVSVPQNANTENSPFWQTKKLCPNGQFGDFYLHEVTPSKMDPRKIEKHGYIENDIVHVTMFLDF